MAVKNLALTAQQTADILAVCETAASRKIGRAERFIEEIILASPRRLAASGRPDRILTAVLGPLDTIARLWARAPAETRGWISRLVDQAQSAPGPRVIRADGDVHHDGFTRTGTND